MFGISPVYIISNGIVRTMGSVLTDSRLSRFNRRVSSAERQREKLNYHRDTLTRLPSVARLLLAMALTIVGSKTRRKIGCSWAVGENGPNVIGVISGTCGVRATG